MAMLFMILIASLSVLSCRRKRDIAAGKLLDFLSFLPPYTLFLTTNEALLFLDFLCTISRSGGLFVSFSKPGDWSCREKYEARGGGCSLSASLLSMSDRLCFKAMPVFATPSLRVEDRSLDRCDTALLSEGEYVTRRSRCRAERARVNDTCTPLLLVLLVLVLDGDLRRLLDDGLVLDESRRGSDGSRRGLEDSVPRSRSSCSCGTEIVLNWAAGVLKGEDGRDAGSLASGGGQTTQADKPPLSSCWLSLLSCWSTVVIVLVHSVSEPLDTTQGAIKVSTTASSELYTCFDFEDPFCSLASPDTCDFRLW